MDEIGFIDNWVFFANESGNPYDLDSALDRLNTIVTEYEYTKESTEFIYYMDRAAEDMVISEENSMGPIPTHDLPSRLEGNPEHNTDIPDEEYQFYIFYILCKLHQELDDYRGMRKLIERYELKYENQPYFGKIKALSLKNSNDDRTLSEALEIAYNNVKSHPKYPDLHKVVAEIIAEMIEKDVQYTGNEEELPSTEQELLEIGNREINRALESDNHPSEYLVVKARIESFRGEHEIANEYISQAIKELSRSRTKYSELRAEYGRIKNRIDTRRQQNQLEKKTSEISESISGFEKKVGETDERISELNNELDSIRQDFQQTFLEFLGFFSAIIAVVVITGQIALEVENSEEIGQLMIISYGGLLFAFGGFAAILSSNRSEAIVRIILSGTGLAISILVLNLI